MGKSFQFKPFTFDANDPLNAEHRAVAAWVEDAFRLAAPRYYEEVDLKAAPSGATINDAAPEQARRYVAAAAIQAKHWTQETDRVRALGETESDRLNPHFQPGWDQVWGRSRQVTTVLKTLLRRKLPLEKSDFLHVLAWASTENTAYFAPIGAIIKALERFSAENEIDDELRAAARRLAEQIRNTYAIKDKRPATVLEQLGGKQPELLATKSASAARPTPQPAPVGHNTILDQLKRAFRMMPDDGVEHVMIAPDQFPMRVDSPVRDEHALLSELFNGVIERVGYHSPDLYSTDAGKTIRQMNEEARGRILLAAMERNVAARLSAVDLSDHRVWQSQSAAEGVVKSIANLPFKLDRDGLADLLLFYASVGTYFRPDVEDAYRRALTELEKDVARAPLTEGERYTLHLIRASIITGPPVGMIAEHITELTRLIGDNASFILVPGEHWSDAVNSEIGASDKQAQWIELIRHLLTATTARPSEKWLKSAEKLAAALGLEAVRESFARWLSLVSRGQSLPRIRSHNYDPRGAADVIHAENATVLRGMLWLLPRLPKPQELIGLIGAVAMTAYKKVPGVGPRAVKVGNGAIYALSEIPVPEAVGQLAMLKVRVKFGTAQKEIEKAFNAAAEALKLPRDQIEEMGVPAYGLEEVGRHVEAFGDYRAELLVSGGDAELKWFDAASGKQLKSVPAKVKKEHGDDYKDLQQSLKDIQAMLPAQRDRIDSMFLLQKSWPISLWRERYHDHPLIGTIARRLIWNVDAAPALFVDGKATDVTGKEIAHGETAEITLWHPVGRSIEEVSAWRRRIEALEITQPFKQAHREIYLLTDAERRTNTYSNRFAAHILRQHQFNALCAARGWKNKLRLMVDDTYPPATKDLPLWGLRAEYWVEGIGEGYGTDTNESGVYLRLSTDQVRFYRTGAAESFAHAGGGEYRAHAAGAGEANINEPIPIEQVPALVFSEIMRDVDLFVGVASVGNDPTWNDGGPGGRYVDYWQRYSFGDLNESASTRRDVLQRLIPRLKIANRCSFGDKFLIVKGDLRTYKIHFGSGNILMEPNDQYLCIVPDARSRASDGDLFLPFEGDNTLSIILSKAMLLANDKKITDPTITRQIAGS
ncbi:MAG TPA: DUF4132 domain-containing protein [Tepidisphaeraceae bacterium]|nr:DUF4132 domain-containing protein [Tepidisphaeraceae bacterium]